MIDSLILTFFSMSLSPRKPLPSYKAAVMANGSSKKKHKEDKRPDLWINHSDNVEMKPLFASTNPNVTNIPRYVINNNMSLIYQGNNMSCTSVGLPTGSTTNLSEDFF